jgi:hypothetical protein
MFHKEMKIFNFLSMVFIYMIMKDLRMLLTHIYGSKVKTILEGQ